MSSSSQATCSALSSESEESCDRSPRLQTLDAEACAGRSRELETRSAAEVLEWAFATWGNDVALVTSFQAEGMVLLDLASRATDNLRVLTLDTGRLPHETYDHIERVRQIYGVEVEMVCPDPARVRQMVARGGPNLFYNSVVDRQECCHVRKVEPLRRALCCVPAWLTGIRRDQTGERRGIHKVELDLGNGPDGHLVKVSPLADWTNRDVWAYIREHSVPYHPLYDRGYLSIGCAPCTRPSRPEEDPRAGRWWWEQSESRECGLHVLDGGAK